MQVTPSWWKSGTASQLEQDIGNGFVFLGTGLYLTDTDVGLVVSTQAAPDDNWWKIWPDETIFTMYVWNCKFHETIISGFIPTRFDNRS